MRALLLLAVAAMLAACAPRTSEPGPWRGDGATATVGRVAPLTEVPAILPILPITRIATDGSAVWLDGWRVDDPRDWARRVWGEGRIWVDGSFADGSWRLGYDVSLVWEFAWRPQQDDPLIVGVVSRVSPDGGRTWSEWEGTLEAWGDLR